jgi:hypothetical protein
MCPLDLTSRAEEIGVLRILSEKLPAPIESVRAKADEFASYWTIGEGAGKRRRNWMAKLREEIRQAHLQGKLKPPGAVEHDSRAGSLSALHPFFQRDEAEQREKISRLARRVLEQARIDSEKASADG